MALSYIGADELLEELIRKKSYGGAKHLGLSTTAPNRDGTGFTQPPASAGYAKVQIGSDPDGWAYMNNARLGSITNGTTIFFPEATAPWGTCKYFLLFDGPEDNRLLAYGLLDEPISPKENDVPMIRPGGIVMTLR